MNQAQALAELLEIEAIKALSVLYSRACDRLDRELLERVYWPDGGDDHGAFKGSAPDYIDWVMNLLAGWTSSHHDNGNFVIELDGHRATGEVHWTGYYRYDIDGQPHDQVAAGRYLDRYEKRFGEWRIAYRTCISEFSRVTPVENDWRNTHGTANIGRRDEQDPLYELQRRGWRL